jgi:hypothetical protein
MSTKATPADDKAAIMKEVCERISNGETLPQVCQDKHLPSKNTIKNWCVLDTRFAEMMLNARLEQAFSWVDQAIEIADSAHEFATGPDGHAQLNAQKLRVDTRIRLMGRINPRLSETSRAGIEVAHEEIPSITPEALKVITDCAQAVRSSIKGPSIL